MNIRKPVIGLTPQINPERQEPFVRSGYIKALRNAGAIPLILPPDGEETELAQLLEITDGVLFTGGPDIHPFFFGEQTFSCCGNVDIRRDQMELALLQLAMNAEKPILGICRGIQLLNIGLGGDLYQDISSQCCDEISRCRKQSPLAHQQPFAYEIPSHTINVVSGSLLERTIPSQNHTGRSRLTDFPSDSGIHLHVNSMHHQAIRRLAPTLTASGCAPDGLTEAIEKPDYPTFFLGVQWHPEYLWQRDAAAAGIFSAFVSAAAKNSRRSGAE